MSTFDTYELRVTLEIELRLRFLMAYVRSLFEDPDTRLATLVTTCTVLLLCYVVLGVMVIGGAA